MRQPAGEANSGDVADQQGQRPRGGVRLRLSALNFMNFAGIGVYMPFMPPWLAAQGLSERQIGLVLAMGMLIRMLASQPITALGDGRHGAARVLVLMHLLGAICFLALMVMPSPTAIIATMAVVALLSSGVIPLGDHLTAAQVRLDPALSFARLRLWGSVSFLLTSLLSGIVISRLGIGTVPVMLCLCSLAAMAVAAAAPGDAQGQQGADVAGVPPEADGLRARLLWCVIIASALINASHAVLYSFGTLHWRTLGIDDSMIGGLWSLAVIAEIALFWWFGRAASASWNAAVLFLAMAGGAAIVRFALMPFAVSLPAVFALQLLHALSFGAQLVGVMALVAMLAPEGRRALTMGRLSAMNACLMGAATLGSGFLFERLGAMSFIAMVPVAMAGLLLLLPVWRFRHSSALDTAPPGALPMAQSARHDGAG